MCREEQVGGGNKMVMRVDIDEFWGETKLKKIIDKQTIAVQKEKEEKRNGKERSLYASDYGQCQRKVFYQFFPEKYPVPELNARVLRIFHNGDAVHERLGEYLRREKEIGFRDEIDIPRDELEVHGRCDGLCTVDGRATVVEFKSINRDVVSEPKEEHIGQTTWYMSMWRDLRKNLREDFGFGEFDEVEEDDLEGVESASGRFIEDLDDSEKILLFSKGEIVGEIIYESKSTNETFHFSVDWDDDRAKKVRLWFEQLDWHVKNEDVPKVKYEKGRFPCSWGRSRVKAGRCPFYDVCWGKKQSDST